MDRKDMKSGMKATVVIPNYNGMKYLEDCLKSLERQEYDGFGILVVDNGSTDGSLELLQEKYPKVSVLKFPYNKGFCAAVNAGIRNSSTPYVILLNNDTKVIHGFVKTMIDAVEKADNIFSVSAKMLQMSEPGLIDDAGDYYCALGWAFARGKGKPAKRYDKRTEIFASCGGAAIYRREVFGRIGYFDEQHFAYLEDIDIGYRARIYGYHNYYEPEACVLHAGSGYSGSRYNAFKVNLSSANSVYLAWKNMPFLQLLLNLPLLLAGFAAKAVFFAGKGLGITYLKGLGRGIAKCCSPEGRKQKVPFKQAHILTYLRIQWELWQNIFFIKT